MINLGPRTSPITGLWELNNCYPAYFRTASRQTRIGPQSARWTTERTKIWERKIRRTSQKVRV